MQSPAISQEQMQEQKLLEHLRNNRSSSQLKALAELASLRRDRTIMLLLRTPATDVAAVAAHQASANLWNALAELKF